ncbi:hypothetical protein F2P56_011873 [Juglans regia]|uniref:Serine/threonine-protein kinase PRP4 homolog n=2 Tax=Juglans regia TaxID=51240 RepID=A0A2I4HQN9_JUGRE|nr:serine/threonine-protein kinase prpf4B-like isoform X1 [Juglans regia]KAF5467641.1 hypothetical protein F2P56_011873 [Juglans regia]
MASESHDKHRRSSSLEYDAERSSKRHKHRHHRHHHRSKKREEETKREGDDINRASPSPPPPPVAISNFRPDDDVEEGEILEEEGFGFGGGEQEIAERKSESDEESRKNVTSGVHSQWDQRNLGHRAKHGSSDHEVGVLEEDIQGNKGRNMKTLEDDKNEEDLLTDFKFDKEDKAYSCSGVGTEIGNEVSFPRNSSVEPQYGSRGQVNGILGHKDEKMWPRESGSPSKGIGKENTNYDDEKVEVYRSKLSIRGNSSSQSIGDHEEIRTRSRSRSIYHARERSHSRSIREEEEAHSKKERYYEHGASLSTDKGKFAYASDDERMARQSKDRWHYSRDVVRDVERECSPSYKRYIGEDRLRSWVTQGRERNRDREMHRELRKEKERERIRNSEMDRAQRREKERERSRDRDRERRIEQDRSREREVDRDRREKERENTKDMEVDRYGKREKERDRSKASERDRVKDTEREKDRDKVRKERENDRERQNDRNRNKDRSIMRDKEKYEFLEDGYENGDRYKHPRYSRHDEKYYDQDKTKKAHSTKVSGSRSNSLEGNRGKLRRHDDEQGDYEEGIALQFGEQEEEDLNRIKEESRRRRQAILEKYKSQPRSENIEKDKEPAHDPDQSVAATDVVPEVGDGRSDGLDVYVTEPSFSVGKSPPNGVAALEKTIGAGGLGEGTPKSESSDDKFCDDIFGETPTGVRKLCKGDGLQIERSGLRDNWDDAEGYYGYRFGEILDGRYEVTAAHGKGVFSTVVRAKNLKAGNGEPGEVAIKIIRSNDTMYKAGLEELVILKKLVGADPDDKRHCVRFISSFKYRNHLCLVFESLHMNLREVLKKFGRNIGLKLTAVRAYAKQLFIALKHLRNCGVLHCDIKPDNMLVNEAKNMLKLCDFGNAMFAGKNEITPYLVSRFYRAPEIILGLPYDHPLDIWSVGCCLYELYTGKVLFPGATNNDMLHLQMELKGPFPKKMLRKGAFTVLHFDQDLNFHATEDDPVTKKTIKRIILNVKPKDISSIITGSPGEDPKMLANFKDLLEKNFVLDPDKRMTVSQALTHPFITGK